MEYQWLPKKLKLNGAVCLEPLNPQDVNNFLAAGGPQLAGIQQAMNSDPALQELAQTPLMLSIMSLACEGADGKALMSHKDDSPQARREHIFQLYVDRMFQRKKSITSCFSQDEAIRWLSWLARKMKEQSQSVFMVEGLQPSWLNSKGHRWAYEAVVVLSIGGLVWSVFKLVGWLFDVWITSLLAWELVIGFSILLGCRSKSSVKSGVISGLLFGLSSWFLFWLNGESSLAILSTVLGVFGGMLGGIGIGPLNKVFLVETMHWQSRSSLKKTVSGLIVGLSVGLGVVVIAWLNNLGVPCCQWLIGVMGFGLIGGLIGGLLGGLVDGVRSDKTLPNQGIKLSFKNALVALFILGLSVGLSVEASSVLMGGLVNGHFGAMVFGLFYGGVAALNRGGSAVVKHYSLRLTLWLTGSTPSLSRFIPFLDHCTKLILLKKVGGGYMFIHRTLLEYFAALPPQDNTVKKVPAGSAS